jgi:hypothetical protein
MSMNKLGARGMGDKIVDLVAFRIEKSLKECGFILKKDEKKNIMILIKVKNEDR